jgi:hypothetical protein
MTNFIKNSTLPIATAVPISPAIIKAIIAVVRVAVTRQVRALDTLLARESSALINISQALIMIFLVACLSRISAVNGYWRTEIISGGYLILPAIESFD